MGHPVVTETEVENEICEEQEEEQEKEIIEVPNTATNQNNTIEKNNSKNTDQGLVNDSGKEKKFIIFVKFCSLCNIYQIKLKNFCFIFPYQLGTGGLYYKGKKHALKK